MVNDITSLPEKYVMALSPINMVCNHSVYTDSKMAKILNMWMPKITAVIITTRGKRNATLAFFDVPLK